MKSISKLKGAIAAFGLMAATHSMAAFENVNSNGLGFGQVSRNVNSSLAGGASLFEGVLYLFAIVFLCLFIFTLVKWKKSDGREGNPGLIAVYLIAAVLCIAGPTVLGGGITTIFGSGQVQTVRAPQPSFN